MKCRTARQKIRLLVGNDLGQNEIEPVQDHIAECDSCRQHVEELLDSSDILVTYSAETLSQGKTSVWKSVVKQLPPQPDSNVEPKVRQVRQSILTVVAVVVISAIGILPDLIHSPGLTYPSGVRVVNPALIDLPAGEYVHHYPDQSWQALEVLDRVPRGNTHGPVRNVVGF
jgi:anti-sigma factor RsiW